MKKIFLPLLTAFIIGTGCETAFPTNSPDESLVIKVECRDETILKQTVLQLLRANKGKDIVVDRDGAFLNIQAAYLEREVPQYKVSYLGRQIREMSGVTKVEIERNRSVILQPH